MWHKYFLKATGITTYITLASAMIIPSVGNRTVANYNFPQRIQLNSETVLKPTDSRSAINKNQDLIEKVKAYKGYQIELNRRKVNLEISYLVNTRGDVETYLQQYTSIDQKAMITKEIQQIETVGHHLLLTDERQAYLSSCISPRSLSTVTQKQFSQQRYQNDLQWEVAWKWLRGEASIRDRRCLWVNLSTPIDSDLQAASKLLETVWIDLYQWWLPNFPPLTD